MTRNVKAPPERIPITNAQISMHPSSSTLTTKAATPQQPNPPLIPPTDYDPPCIDPHDGHNHTHFKGSNTDIKTLRANVPIQYANILNEIQKKLRSMLGMHEVTTGEPSGPVISFHLKGTAQVLHEAQERLGRMINLNIFEEQDRAEHTRTTSKTAPAHRPEHLEAPMGPASTTAQPPVPPPTVPRTRGTPDKPVDAAADATAPSDGSTCAATKPQRNEKRPASRHGERTTTHLTKSTASRNEVVKGVMKKNDKTFGFIQAEDGTDMFVMPSACANFGHQLQVV